MGSTPHSGTGGRNNGDRILRAWSRAHVLRGTVAGALLLADWLLLTWWVGRGFGPLPGHALPSISMDVGLSATLAGLAYGALGPRRPAVGVADGADVPARLQAEDRRYFVAALGVVMGLAGTLTEISYQRIAVLAFLIYLAACCAKHHQTAYRAFLATGSGQKRMADLNNALSRYEAMDGAGVRDGMAAFVLSALVPGFLVVGFHLGGPLRGSMPADVAEIAGISVLLNCWWLLVAVAYRIGRLNGWVAFSRVILALISAVALVYAASIVEVWTSIRGAWLGKAFATAILLGMLTPAMRWRRWFQDDRLRELRRRHRSQAATAADRVVQFYVRLKIKLAPFM